MGGHPVKCPMLNVGIQLDPATRESGQLRDDPGSHRGTSRLPSAREAGPTSGGRPHHRPRRRDRAFRRRTPRGAAPGKPAGVGTAALYLSFVPPLTFEMVGPGQGYNDVLFTRSGGPVQHVDQFR